MHCFPLGGNWAPYEPGLASSLGGDRRHALPKVVQLVGDSDINIPDRLLVFIIVLKLTAPEGDL